jgi:hypothetical protein
MGDEAEPVSPTSNLNYSTSNLNFATSNLNLNYNSSSMSPPMRRPYDSSASSTPTAAAAAAAASGSNSFVNSSVKGHKKRISSIGGAIIVDDADSASNSSDEGALFNGAGAGTPSNAKAGNGRLSNGSAVTDDGDDSDWSGGETVVCTNTITLQNCMLYTTYLTLCSTVYIYVYTEALHTLQWLRMTVTQCTVLKRV